MHSGIDGCGAPVHALSLHGLARSLSRMAGPGADEQSAFLCRAILANGWAIDGPGRTDTVVVEKLGVVAKRGAEGVMIMATPEGIAVAVKILDGELRAAALVAIELLVTTGGVAREAADDALAQIAEPVLGGGVPVGRIRTNFRRH